MITLNYLSPLILINLMARTEEEAQKIFTATEFSEENPMQDIPYPDYNNQIAVENIWKQITSACIGILNHFLNQKDKPQ